MGPFQRWAVNMSESYMPRTGTGAHHKGYENDVMHLGHAGMKLVSSEPETLKPSVILLLKAKG